MSGIVVVPDTSQLQAQGVLTLEDLAEQLTERPAGLSVYASSERGRGGLQIGKRRESYSVA